MRGRAYSVLWIAVSCLALGMLPTVIEVLFHKTRDPVGLNTLTGVIYSCCIGIPCWYLLPKAYCRLENRSFGVILAASIAILGALGTGGFLAGTLILRSLHRVGPVRMNAGDFWISFRISLFITFTFGLVMVVVGALQSRLASVKAELQQRQISEERERKIAAQARFASLESRVRPHFLFNTLNSISALVREDPQEAERMIERLSALLRFSLDSDTDGTVPLREELGIVRDYLDIEKVRFGDRLRYRFEIGAEAESHLVPALSIQTLVENSVKHAVGPRKQGAEIVITARMEGSGIRIEVSDDGPGFEPAASVKPGHGLDLLERRLASLFGSAASLEMSARDGRTMIAICFGA